MTWKIVSPSPRRHPHPVIVLGAARSGTKIVRSLIASSRCYAPVPYDVNYIWRFGNESSPHDILDPAMATSRVRQFIRKQLRACAGITRKPFGLVEKTVSNVLRLPFVTRVYPEAKFVFLIRDGRDVMESAERCWREPPQFAYLLGKLRTFPWLSCAGYGHKYLRSVIFRSLGMPAHVNTWGPRYPGIDDDARQGSLLTVCARQWLASIELYEAARHLVPPGQLLELKYEDLVRKPIEQARHLGSFLEIEDTDSLQDYASANLQSGRVGSHARIPPDQLRLGIEIARPALERWGYLSGTPLRKAA